MAAPTNESLASAILGQQEEIGKLSKLVGDLSAENLVHSNVVLQLQEQILGFGAAFQVFAELVMAASPEFKQQVAIATTQVLARRNDTDNETLRDVLSALNKAATSASRTSPEGRRANLQVVPGGESVRNDET